jgi:gluconokinase
MKRGEYIIGLDIGTTSTKGLLFEINGSIVNVRSENYQIYYPGHVMVEQDPEEVLHAVIKVVYDLVTHSRIPSVAVISLVFGGILHSLIPVDKSGNALSRALIWADSRSTEQSEQLRKEMDVEDVKLRTGCTIHPLYFLPRLAWLKIHRNDVLKHTFKIISIKEYIIHKLYDVFIVDRSIASGTGVWNVRTMNWDSDLLNAVKISSHIFSRIVEPTYILKGLKHKHASAMGIPEGTPSVIGASDGPLAHLGSTGLRDQAMSLTIGSSGALRRSVHEPTILHGREAWCYYLYENNWILGAVTHDAGIVVKWLSDNFLTDTFDDINAWAEKVPAGSEGLLFFPFLGGEKSPHYNPSARGAVIGLSFSHEKKHIIRALMEGISYRLYSNYRMLVPKNDMDLVVTGGILKSPIWMQITADFFGKRLYKPGVVEASAWGAVLLGLRALGVIKNMEEMKRYTEYSEFIEYNPHNHLIYKEVNRLYENLYSRLFS